MNEARDWGELNCRLPGHQVRALYGFAAGLLCATLPPPQLYDAVCISERAGNPNLLLDEINNLELN
jgi:hypothetical protein